METATSHCLTTGKVTGESGLLSRVNRKVVVMLDCDPCPHVCAPVASEGDYPFSRIWNEQISERVTTWVV